MTMKTNRNRKGFTLSELLVVVAIIAVLVAISIPIFTTQIHKSQVATDWANVRSYYSYLQYDYMQNETIDSSKLIYSDTYKDENGNTVKLKAGTIYIIDGSGYGAHGYAITYICNKNDNDHYLFLSSTTIETGY